MNIAILTNFRDWNRGYSLIGVVSNLVIMFDRFGHQIDVLVNEDFKDSYPVPKEVSLRKIMPKMDLIDYKTQNDLTPEHKTIIDTQLVPLFKQVLPQYDLVILMDFTYTGWNMPYALALQQCVEETQHTCFLHFINSVPPRNGLSYDWWDFSTYNKYGNHKLVSFTQHNKALIETAYKAKPEDVVVVPHIVDARIEGDFCKESWDLIDRMPNILQGDIVCVYPASTDRLRAKQVQVHLALFDGFKRRCFRTALVFANQWATGRCPQEQKDKYIKFGEGLGLKYGEEFIFTSDVSPNYQAGISKKMLRDLNSCANLFIFPSIEESFGLVSLEGSLCGQYLVANADVGCFKEIYGDCAHYEAFGSLEHCDFYGKSGQEIADYMDKVSVNILTGMKSDLAIQMKTRCRIQNNLDAIYLKYYEELLK